MRYFYEPDKKVKSRFGQIYCCPNTLFDLGTLYLKDDLGLIVVQAEFDNVTKQVSFGPIDPGLAHDIYIQTGFEDYFSKHAGKMTGDGCYPVVNVRKVMWALRMKPLKRELWEQELQRLL